MELAFLIVACVAVLFVVDVFLGGTVPGAGSGPAPMPLPAKEFFGRLLPLALLGIGLPLSVQHVFGVWLIACAVVLFLVFLRSTRSC